MGRGRIADAGSTRSRTAVIGVVAALLGVVGYSNVYLPYYSSQAAAARSRTATTPRAAKGDLAPGSTWSNMAKQRDFLSSPGEPMDGSDTASGPKLA